MLSDNIKKIGEYGYYFVWAICIAILLFQDLTPEKQTAVFMYALLPVNWVIFYILGSIVSLFE